MLRGGVLSGEGVERRCGVGVLPSRPPSLLLLLCGFCDCDSSHSSVRRVEAGILLTYGRIGQGQGRVKARKGRGKARIGQGRVRVELRLDSVR